MARKTKHEQAYQRQNKPFSEARRRGWGYTLKGTANLLKQIHDHNFEDMDTNQMSFKQAEALRIARESLNKSAIYLEALSRSFLR